MTEKEMFDEFWSFVREVEPYHKEAFKAYVTGESDEWPQDSKTTWSISDKIIEEYLAGPEKNRVLAKRILTAMTLSCYYPGYALESPIGVEVLKTSGTSFEEIVSICTEYSIVKQWRVGRDAAEFYPVEAMAALDQFIADNPACIQNSQTLYDFQSDANLKGLQKTFAVLISAVAVLAARDPAAYARFIPLLERFIASTLDKDDLEIVWGKYREGRDIHDDHIAAAHACFVVGAGDLSPALHKLYLRCILNTGGNWRFYYKGSSRPMMSKDELWERGKALGLPAEWFELMIFGESHPAPDKLSIPAYFDKLFRENRPLFDKVHRAFYWFFDGKTANDFVARPSKSEFKESLYLLAIKAAGDFPAAQKDLDELKNNFDALLTLNSKSFEDHYAAWFFMPVLEYGIPQLDAPFDEDLNKTRAEEDQHGLYYWIQAFINCRAGWVSSQKTAEALLAGNHFSFEEVIRTFTYERNYFENDAGILILHEVMRHFAALHPEETNAYIKQNIKTLKSDVAIAWFQAIFTEGGLPAKDALLLLASPGKKVLSLCEKILLPHKELRSDTEVLLPALKKDGAVSAQRLIAQWNNMR
jgi:hypothetical protein